MAAPDQDRRLLVIELFSNIFWLHRTKPLNLLGVGRSAFMDELLNVLSQFLTGNMFATKRLLAARYLVVVVTIGQENGVSENAGNSLRLDENSLLNLCREFAPKSLRWLTYWAWQIEEAA